MADEKKVKLNGYHIVPHEISVLDKKTYKKYIMKKKLTIASAFLEVVNDFYMGNKVSYSYYSKKWGWHRAVIKEFLNHIGFDIPTVKNQFDVSYLTLVKPKKSANFDESILGIANKIFDKHFDKHNSENLTSKPHIKSDTYEDFCQAQQDDFDKHSDKINIRINKSNSGYNNQVEELFNYYHEKTNAYKHNSNQAKKNIKKLLKTYKLDTLKKCIDNYSLDIQQNQTERKFIIRCANFFGEKASFIDYLPENYQPSKSVVNKEEDKSLKKLLEFERKRKAGELNA